MHSGTCSSSTRAACSRDTDLPLLAGAAAGAGASCSRSELWGRGLPSRSPRELRQSNCLLTPPKMGTSGIPAIFRRSPGPRAEPGDWGGPQNAQRSTALCAGCARALPRVANVSPLGFGAVLCAAFQKGSKPGVGKGKGQKPFEAGGGVGQDSGVGTAEIKRGFSSSKRGASVLVSPCQSSGQALLPLQYLFPIAFAGCRCRKWVA